MLGQPKRSWLWDVLCREVGIKIGQFWIGHHIIWLDSLDVMHVILPTAKLVFSHASSFCMCVCMCTARTCFIIADGMNFRIQL